jgi:hypothetical protein
MMPSAGRADFQFAVNVFAEAQLAASAAVVA